MYISTSRIYKRNTHFTKKGVVKNIVIISAGFKEKDKEGENLENEILNIAKEKGFRILGPNCLGYISTSNNINLSFAADNPLSDNVAFISQSGAICTAILDMSIPQKLGFSHFISIGNTVDIEETELISYLNSESSVKVIGAYLEEISYGRKLINTYTTLQNRKPLIVLKPGKSDEAKKAIQSHTGSVAGSKEILDTAFNQAGIIPVTSITSLFYHMLGFSWLNIPKGNRVAIVTNAGGPGILATDQIVTNGLKIAQISKSTSDSITIQIPEISSLANPIDILGDGKANRYEIVLKQLINDENIDSILLILTPQFMTEVELTSQVIVNISKETDKPIIPIYLGDESIRQGQKILMDNRIPVFTDINHAIKVLSSMYQYYQISKKDIKEVISKTNDKGKYKDEIKYLLQDELIALPEQLVSKMLKEFDIKTPNQKVCKNLEELKQFAIDEYPVVLKVPNHILAHKTDTKGLIVNIKNQKELVEAYDVLERNHKASMYLIQKQIKTKEELILGIKRDGNSQVYNTDMGFGHLLMFGKGGIYTEVYKDYAYTLIPSTKDEIIKMISNTKVFNILNGARGQEPLALNKLLDLIQKLQELILTYPEIDNLDINPVFIDENEVYAVDVKIFVKK